MIARRHLVALFSVLAFLLAPLAADAKATALVLVGPDLVNEAAVLPPPAVDPASELAELHRIETARTPEQAARAKADSTQETVFLFASALGDGFTAERLPVVAAFFAKVANDGELYSRQAKAIWARPRPFVTDPTLHPIGGGSVGSYPSSHATLGWLQGVVLAAMLPEKQGAILSRAADFAYNRLICGVHYRSDIEGGQVLGTLLAIKMLEQPAVQAEFQAAQAELKAAGY